MSEQASDSSSAANMNARALVLAENLRTITTSINAIADPARAVRLVAVSKYKPLSDIVALHEKTGHRHFGENYVQELLDKAANGPREIDWHFIGQLQTNKCKTLAERIPNLWAVESVDVLKKADALEKGRANLIRASPEAPKLRVFVQVNTSGEEAKSGCDPANAVSICKHITSNCPHLILQGLMTIGSLSRSKEAKEGEENQDFVILKKAHDEVSKELPEVDLELSMGMSQDFETAIKMGATNVRVGTAVFGGRPTPNATT